MRNRKKIEAEKKEIESIVEKTKECISLGHYVFEKDEDDEREKNRYTASVYNLDVDKRLDIIKNLTYLNFAYTRPEQKKSLEIYEDTMYVFFTEEQLKDTDEEKEDSVCLYIKLQFTKIPPYNLLIISFHTAEKPPQYRFR